MYDYMEALKSDVMEYINDNKILDEYAEDDEDTVHIKLYDLGIIQDQLYDDLWTEDSVTGNASGSYFFNSAKARECVLENMELAVEAITEFEMVEKFVP